jgi:hypothetical protein
MPSFFAALPLSSGEFAWAKLKCVVRIVITFWAWLALFTAAISLVFRIGTPWKVLFATLQNHFGTYHAAAILVLTPLGMFALAAAAATCIVWVNLLGRGRGIFGHATLGVLCALVLISPLLSRHPERISQLVETIPDLLLVLALAKVTALVWLGYLVSGRRLYSVVRVAWICGSWVAAVAGASAICLRGFSHLTDTLAIVCGVIVMMPVLGILGAPLALQLNRCR